MHQRRLIRNEIVRRLKTGVDILGTSPVEKMKLDVGGRIFASRPSPIFDTEVPCALVYFQTESCQTNAGRNIQDRVASINIDLLQELREGLDDELDRLAWQTEIILLSDHTLGLDFVNFIELSSTTPYQDNIDGEQYRGITRLTFDVAYWTEVYSPGTLDEFLSFGKEIKTTDGAISKINRKIREE